MNPRAAALLLVLSWPLTAGGVEYFYSAGDLLENCASDQPSRKIFCLGFLAGAADTTTALEAAFVEHSPREREYRECVPTNTPLNQLRESYLEWAYAHPETLHEPATWMTARAFRKTFSCP